MKINKKFMSLMAGTMLLACLSFTEPVKAQEVLNQEVPVKNTDGITSEKYEMNVSGFKRVNMTQGFN